MSVASRLLAKSICVLSHVRYRLTARTVAEQASAERRSVQERPLKVIGMAFRERSSINQNRAVYQTTAGNGHPARSRLNDLRMLEY